VAQTRVILPAAVTTAVDLIEARIRGLQAPGEGQEDFSSGMVFGLREAEACLMQALVTEGKAGG
jgi:hypothetical protein